MDRLISANYMREHILIKNDPMGLADVIRQWIDAQPTVNAVPREWFLWSIEWCLKHDFVEAGQAVSIVLALYDETGDMWRELNGNSQTETSKAD